MPVAYLPYGLPAKRFARLAQLPLSSVQWPMEGADWHDLIDPSDCIGDLTEDDHLGMYLSSRALTANLSGLKCRVSIMVFEPRVIQGWYYRILPFYANRFHRIFTHNTDLLKRIPNARFQFHGDAKVEVLNEFPHKASYMAMIASGKTQTVGHRLRHRIAGWSKKMSLDLSIMGRGYRAIENKAEGHAPYRFSVVIENCREPGYFTEKLIDSLLCYSLPIYWGAPDVTRYFDPRGIVLCSSEEELKQAILAADENEFKARLPYLRENHERAIQLAKPWVNIAEYLECESFTTRRWATQASNSCDQRLAMGQKANVETYDLALVHQPHLPMERTF